MYACSLFALLLRDLPCVEPVCGNASFFCSLSWLVPLCGKLHYEHWDGLVIIQSPDRSVLWSGFITKSSRVLASCERISWIRGHEFNMRRFRTSHVRMRLYDLPLELLRMIVRHLHPSQALALLQAGGRGSAAHAIILETMYEKPFTKEDLPDEMGSRYPVYTSDSRRAVRRVEAFLNAPKQTRGQYVRYLSIPNIFSHKLVGPLLQMCTRLKGLDLTALGHAIDRQGPDILRISGSDTGIVTRLNGRTCDDETWTVHRGPPLAEDITNVDAYDEDLETIEARILERGEISSQICFGWEDLLSNFPQTFKLLQTLKLQPFSRMPVVEKDDLQATGTVRHPIPLYRHPGPHGRALAYQRFVLLLNQVPLLETLELHGVGRWISPDTCLDMQGAMAQYLGRHLKTLKLINVYGFVRHLKFFLKPLEVLENLTTIVISINADLAFLEGLQENMLNEEIADSKSQAQLNEEDDLLERTLRTQIQYLRMLRSVIDRTYYDNVSSDNHLPSRTWIIQAANDSEDYPLNPRPLIRTASEEDGAELLEWLCETFNWSPVFSWEKYMHKVRYANEHIAIDGEKISDERFCKMDDRTRQRCVGEVQDLFARLRFLGRNIKLLVPGDCYSGTMIDVLERTGVWHLNSIGPDVSDLRIEWGLQAPFILDGEIGETDRPVPAEDRNTCLFTEAVKMYPIWTDLHKIFPNIRRFKVLVPKVLYPRNDTDFIEAVLPGSSWSVQSHEDRDGRFGVFLERVFVRGDVDDGEPEERPPYVCEMYSGGLWNYLMRRLKSQRV